MRMKNLLLYLIPLSTVLAFGQESERIVGTKTMEHVSHFFKKWRSTPTSDDKFALPEFQPQDLVIGQTDPNEVMTITGSYFLDGNLTIVNNGVLNLDDADFQIRGDIFIMGSGQLNVTGGTFTVIQEYIYEHDAVVVENGRFQFSGVKFQSSGQSWSNAFTNQAEYILEDSEISDGFITTGLLEEATATITGTNIPGEFLCFGENDVTFNRCDTLLMWLVLPDSSVVEASLPDDSLVVGWRFSEAVQNVENIPYSLEIDSCTGVMWGLISITGSDATFRDTEFRTIGLMFTEPDSIAISGIHNESNNIDDIADVPDRTLRLINSDVHTWSFYPSVNSNISINNCVFGELLGQDNAKVFITNSVCDGSGGYLGAFHQSFVVVVNSFIRSQVISRENGALIGAESAFWGTEIDADEASVMFLANTAYQTEPEAHMSAIIFEGRLSPVEGMVDSRIPILGTARLLAGPERDIEFLGYRIDYSPGFEDPVWNPIDGFHPDAVLNDTLAFWNTVGLDPGDYGLQLSLFHSLGDSIGMNSYARLDAPVPVSTDRMDRPLTFSLGKNYPNPFNATTTIPFTLPLNSSVQMRIFDIQGREVAIPIDAELPPGNHRVLFDARQLASGIYSIVLQAGNQRSSQKMILLK